MNALIISGSRDLEGRTAQAIAALAEGLEAARASCETVFLPTLDLESEMSVGAHYRRRSEAEGVEFWIKLG